MEQKLSNWERLESVVKWADMTTNYFARYIGIPNAENLYRIKRGQNGISDELAKRIVEKFPQINIVWLKMGFGEMFGSPENNSSAKPLYNVSIEDNIRNIESLKPSDHMVLPPSVDCDFGMLYLGRAMGVVTPPNTVVLLKKILPEMIIPGDECVIVSKKIVLLRNVTFEEVDFNHTRLRLKAEVAESFGDVTVAFDQVEAVYKVKGKILINN